MSRRKIKEGGLTEVQETVLEMVVVGQRLCGAGRGRVPTYREMASWMGSRNPSAIKEVLDVLERKGYVRRVEGESRGWDGPGRRTIEVLRVVDGGIIPGASAVPEDISSPSGP